MKSWKCIISVCFLILFAFYGCKNIPVPLPEEPKEVEVTREILKTIGPEMFSNCRFRLSKSITLREIVKQGDHLEQTGPGTIVVTNVELYFSQFIIGGFLKEIPPDRIQIYFEELPDGNKPALTFVLNTENNGERYYIETTEGEGYVVDAAGNYGYIKWQDKVVSYNGLNYFISYDGAEKPYLIQELDVNVMQNIHIVPGVN